MVSTKRSSRCLEDEDVASLRDAFDNKRLCSRLSMDDFLSFDGPTGIAVGPDGTRSDFFLHLGLSERNNRHRIIYRRMKQEAKNGMERLFDTRKSLQPEMVDDDSVQAPYNLKQITEWAFQRQVEHIYDNASINTRGIYDIIRTGDGSNWVIRWMLWRVIQCAQDRVIRATSSGGETECSTLTTCSTATDHSSVRTEETSPAYWPSTVSPHDFSDSDDWDPSELKSKVVRDEYVFTKPRLPQTPSKFWAHVMDNT
ncbi:hypothetical protein CLAFUW4_06404 [Fulvia fulva]|uniref:Uncharacterized protein n=1 Tax=Passalora fulva TaxID=5499 RepID=A0A9Q8P971_PASFU|nr:uncharacterized protein CLAFUR5_06548 [Fulvia fulva]KAK4623923.1 hypothetical protein CLAFUR4_06407 [Fulvia fulva]KAK4626010.1 hypothetical protein CLAFUR0_06408 [Fulvia fulva]UJO17848.1 hypothetical protein CLAFUR5_06548 [Fulvia fulva]WPV14885.1 hypothetical protein CLAFUW4_06404 [Fulvia fulva]WPV30016.1 hypothetical protein CLAFUW7_06402 [Fulvia fulva]